MADQTAWVIVRGDVSNLRYFRGFRGLQDARGNWTRDPNLALKMPTEELAMFRATQIDDAPGDMRIEEHMWISPPVGDAP